jgi:hypothetical protein
MHRGLHNNLKNSHKCFRGQKHKINKCPIEIAQMHSTKYAICNLN